MDPTGISHTSCLLWHHPLRYHDSTSSEEAYYQDRKSHKRICDFASSEAHWSNLKMCLGPNGPTVVLGLNCLVHVNVVLLAVLGLDHFGNNCNPFGETLFTVPWQNRILYEGKRILVHTNISEKNTLLYMDFADHSQMALGCGLPPRVLNDSGITLTAVKGMQREQYSIRVHAR